MKKMKKTKKMEKDKNENEGKAIENIKKRN